MARLNCLNALMIVFVFPLLTLGYDPAPLQDICVADLNNPVRVNGKVCKDPKQAQANDFFTSGFNIPTQITAPFGIGVKSASVNEVPGLNTQGLTGVRQDFAVNGFIPLHIHPRASEIQVVIDGTLLVGFVTSENKLISKVLKQGDFFVFPFGLPHFQTNIGRSHATIFIALSSQNPGLIFLPNAAFGTKPPIPAAVLAKNFQIDESTANSILSKFQ